VKAIARRKVTQLKSSVSKALSSITTNASLSNQVDQKKKPKNSQKMRQFVIKLKKKVKKVCTKKPSTSNISSRPNESRFDLI
jgi:hypothetical protein